MQLVAHGEPAGKQIVASRAELTSVTAGCGIYHVDRALFLITGRDRTRWLNGMVSNNIRDLGSGRGVYAFMLNPQGQILGDLYIYNRGESLVAEIDRTQLPSLIQTLKRYIIMDKVEIADQSDEFSILGLAGPRTPEILASAGFISNLDTLEIAEVHRNDLAITLVHSDNASFPVYEAWVPTRAVDSALEALVRAGGAQVGSETVESFRILCGIPKFGQDIRDKTLPQETGQDRALNFNKGCYIGQEIVERIRARGAVHRTFIGFESERELPDPGTKVQSEDKDVGQITSVMPIPLKGKHLGLGYLRKEFLDKVLTAGGVRVRAAALPLTNLV